MGSHKQQAPSHWTLAQKARREGEREFASWAPSHTKQCQCRLGLGLRHTHLQEGTRKRARISKGLVQMLQCPPPPCTISRKAGAASELSLLEGPGLPAKPTNVSSLAPGREEIHEGHTSGRDCVIYPPIRNLSLGKRPPYLTHMCPAAPPFRVLPSGAT